MSAQVGYRWLYASVTRDLDDDRRVRVDALLGMPGAAEAYQVQRREQVVAAGVDFG